MPTRSPSTDAKEEASRSPSGSPQLRTYVFPYTASPAEGSSGNDAADATDDAASDHFDDVRAFHAVHREAPQTNPGPRAHSRTAAGPHAALPPFLSVDELHGKNAAPPSSTKREQRVRFAVGPHDNADTAAAATAATTAPTVGGADADSTTGIVRVVNFDHLEAAASGDDEDAERDDDSDDDDDDRDPVEPYSMITKTGGTHIHLHTQLLALLQRTSRQYQRKVVTLVAEIVSPLLFVVLIIILNVAFGTEEVAERNYAYPLTMSYQLNTLDYQTYTCYNDTTQPISGLYSCDALRLPYSCDGDDSGIPVYGLCYASAFTSLYAVVEQYVASMLGTLITIPTLDSIIVHQWLAKKAGLAASSRTRTALAALSDVGIGVSATTRYDSISYSGKLYFAPAANVPASLLTYIRSQSSMFDYVYGGTFDTVAEAEAFVKSSTATQKSLNSIWGLVVVDDITDNFKVQIRLHGSALPTLQPAVSVEYRSGFFSDGTDMYLASGFLTLQKVLYDYFYASKVDNGDMPNVDAGVVSPYGTDNVYTLIGAFPSRESKNPYIFSFASSLVAFILVLSFLYPFSQMTKRLVLEKELRIRESMCIMGLRRSSLWLNYLLVSFLEYFLVCILLTILLCAVVVKHSNPYVIFLILLLYSFTLIPLSGLLSTFFGRARMAALMSPLVYFILSMPIFAMGSAGRSVVIGLSILSPTGLAAMLTNVFEAEAGSGFNPDDFQNPYFSAKPYIVMIMLACDVALYMLLMFYLDVVLPQEWGTSKHPLFFILEPYAFLKESCCCCCASKSASRRTTATSADSNDRLIHRSSIETPETTQEMASTSEGNLFSNDETTVAAKIGSGREVVLARGSIGTASTFSGGATSTTRCVFDPAMSRDSLTGALKEVGVRVDNLSKSFTRNGKPFAAVRDFAWNLYRGEIAVLLGPNGAGKSTTINMVTGMLAADSGDCYIEGHSVTKQTALARHEIGYCPQHNILWPDLTCREHLEFYGKIKGLRGADLEDAVVDILRAVDLEEKIDCIPTLMSGGQKRKLSVAIAFVGRNRVVLLDEPTAGMDPAARRHTWSLLRVMAEQRTIMLTTHYMDEADLLGDNVAIVTDGVLQCSGSTQFLRHYAGVGYTVRFDLSPIPAVNGDAARQAEVEAVWAKLDEVVHCHLLQAKLVLQTDAEVEYEMPQQAEAHIPEFLQEMETRGNKQLGIRGYALKAPTLEDVFLRVVEHQVPTTTTTKTSAATGNATTKAASIAGVEKKKDSVGGTTIDKTDPITTTAGSSYRRVSTFVSAAPITAPAREGGNGGAGSQPSSPPRSSDVLQRRMSRASLRFFNNETRLNYAGDAEPSGADDDDDDVEAEDISVMDSGLIMVNARKNSHNQSWSNLRGAGGEDEVPGPRASFVFGMADASSPLSAAAQSPHPPSRAAAAAADGVTTATSHTETATADATSRAAISETPTVAVTVGPSGGKRARTEPFATSPEAVSAAATTTTATTTTTNATAATAAPVDSAAVRNEAYLYKHVTDRHLDQVWATRAISRRGTLWALQMRGMMYKRFFCAIRDRRMLFFQIVCPVLCILLAMLLQLVKNPNNGTVQLSPDAFLETTAMPVSSCTNYYGPVSLFSSLARQDYNVDITDGNFAASSDLSYEMLDTWYSHPYGRYVALQCAETRMATFMKLLYSTSVNGRALATLLYNTSSHNSLPIALHTAYALAYFAGRGNADSAFEMSVTSLPETKKSSQASNAIAGILIGVIVLIPFTFLPANPVAWVVKEYETRARHLQTVSGLRYLIYWASNFLFDFTAYVVTIILVMIIFVIFQRSEYIGYATIGPTIVAFAVYGVCYCCTSYMVSFFFHEHTTAQLVVLGVSFLTGFLCVMLVFVLSLLDKTLSASNTLRWIFRLLPPYSIGEVILNLALLEQKKLTDETLTAWSMSITVWPIIYMAAETPVFAAVTLLWDHPNRRAVIEKLRSCCSCRSTKKKQQKTTAKAAAAQEGKKDHEEVEEEDNAAPSPVARGRRQSVTNPAITPVAQRRAQQAGSAPAAPAGTTDETSGVFANSPSLRRRRSSAGGPNNNSNNNNASLSATGPTAIDIASPESFYVPLPSPHQPSSMQLPTVLVPTPETNLSHARREVSVQQRSSRRLSAAESVRMQLSTLTAAPQDMVYPPSQWYVADRVCMEEEDSDVEEERNAVYAEERVYLAEGRPAAAPSPRKEKKKKHHHTNVLCTPEDHQPESTETSRCEAADVIRVVDLRKVYDAPHKVAVSGLNFSVMHGEVFGFLGTNGAGKSSALSILTQEQLPTSGRAYVCGHDVVRNSFEAANCLGYCPQFDACLDLLTVKEHLRMYALVRGVPTERIDDLITSLLTICNLVEHRNVLSSALSGGNRRKLSVAIALIGAPKVVCLDEPTSGLDPLARRLLWRALDRVSRKCSIILTTHHLEEVEALADCVGIMVDGGLRCFGDLPHLKHKYARNAYELTLCVSPAARRRAQQLKSQRATGAAGSSSVSMSRSRLASISYAGTDRIDTSDDIFQFMLRHFPSALLVDNFNNERYVYTLPATRDVANAMLRLQNQQQRRQSLTFGGRSNTFGFASGTHSSFNGPILRLSEVFEKLRAAQTQLGITQYSVSQVSLEQVFLRVCGTTEETKAKKRRMSTMSGDVAASVSMTAAGGASTSVVVPNASSYLASQSRVILQQQQRQRRSSSIFVDNARYAGQLADAASPSRRRLSVAALGGPATRITFAEYRRQRALLRLRVDAETPQPTPSEAQRATEPDHCDSS